MKKLWGSTFSKDLNESVNDFNSSLRFDRRLCKYDIEGSIAHVIMLGERKIISEDEAKLIKDGLSNLLKDYEEGTIDFSRDFEDIHTLVETLLTEKIGDTAKKMHTARSRNDQVALDMKMYLRDEISEIQNLVMLLCKFLIVLMKKHSGTIMPGYTHLQKAQPITFGHHLGAYFEMFLRDFSRLKDIHDRINRCPLGAGALATGPHNIDRFRTAELLHFDGICLNSIDAVSDRDYVIELLGDLSIIMMHLSRFSEELILWASNEFRFITIDDAFATGSSIMPQKKNPDIPELIRGKSGRVYGSLVSMLTTMKSLPLAYNKDMQEDKEPVFDAIDTVKACLSILPEMLATMKVNRENMLRACSTGFLNATDAADYLVKKGVPFRDAHAAAGEAVKYCTENSKTLEEMSLDEYKKINELFEEDIYNAINIVNSLNSRNVIGGPAEDAMSTVIYMNEERLKANG